MSTQSLLSHKPLLPFKYPRICSSWLGNAWYATALRSLYPHQCDIHNLPPTRAVHYLLAKFHCHNCTPPNTQFHDCTLQCELLEWISQHWEKKAFHLGALTIFMEAGGMHNAKEVQVYTRHLEAEWSQSMCDGLFLQNLFILSAIQHSHEIPVGGSSIHVW